MSVYSWEKGLNANQNNQKMQFS